MALIRWRPGAVWSPFAEIQDEMNKLFDLGSGRLRGDIVPWSPALDIYEAKDNLVVKTDMPGIDEKDVDVSIQGDMLTIRGERKEEKEEKEKGYFRCERCYGSFQRSVKLPYAVDQSQVRASYRGGVLEIRLPKAEEAKQKKIKIEIKD